jgi:hypothetical protein
MKKLILAICVLALLLVPVTAFAAPPADDNPYETLPDNPQPWGDKHIPPDISDYIGQSSGGTGESGAASEGGATVAGSTITPMAVSLPVAGATKVTKSLTRDEWWYSTEFYYTAPTTGVYYFSDTLTETYSGIEIDDMAGNRVISDFAMGEPFSVLVLLKAGYKYKIYMESYSKSITYIMTSPVSLGNAAYSVKSNGYSYDWYQSFRFTVPNDQIYSFHITNPSNSEFIAGFFTSDGEPYYGYGSESEVYDFDVFYAGTYDLVLYMSNYSSNTAAFTIAMDPEGNKHMDNGVTVSTSLAANDMLTSNAIEPETTGGYRFACSRSDAKLSIMHLVQDSEGHIVNVEHIAKNVSANTRINLVKDELYMVYLSTDGTAGTMTYSATYLSPVSTLSGITASAGTLSPVFNSGTTGYTLLVDSVASSSVTITPKPTAVGGTMKIDGTVQASKTYSVNASTNQTVTIAYTSPDGSKTSTYTVNLRAKSKACAVTSGGSSLNFDGYTLSANVDNSTTSLAADVSVSDRATWKLYSDSACTSEIADKTMTLSEGLNRAYVKVTSEDGRNSAVYPVLVYRAALADPKILAFNTSRGEISSGAFTTSSVVVKLLGTADLNGTATKNGAPISWPGGDLFTADGAYAVSLTDGNGATASFSFTIDKTAPAISAKDSANATVAKGALTNKTVKVTVSDTNLNTKSVKKDNATISWPAGDTFTADGAYTITANDRAGNSASYTFTIDRTAPAISAVFGSTKLANDAYVKGNVVVTVSDARLSSKTATKNGATFAWPGNNTFVDAAVYVITAKDTAGNTSTLKFTIDKTLPTITAKVGSKTLKSGSSTKSNVVLTVTETNVGSKTVTRGGAAFTWPANNTFTAEGAYVVKVTDRSGNAVTFSFNIDKPPVLTVKTLTTGKTIANKGLTNEGVVVTLSEAFLKSRTIKKSGKSITWPADGKLMADGKYSISVKDKIGNSLSYSFTVDRTAPTVTVKTKAKKVLANGGATNEAYVSATFADASKYTKSVTKDGKSMSFPSKFTSEGTYIITATDAAGNKTTFKFVIDRVAPVISCKTSGGKAMTSGATVNQNVVITITDRAAVTKTLTLNGKTISWPANNTVTADGKYVVTAKDSLGYSAAAYTFTIDKTGPSITAKNSSNAAVANNGATNKNVTVTVSGQTGAVTATKNGSAFAYPAGGVFSAEGLYVVSAADSLGNRTTFTFTIDKTAPAISAKDSSNAAVANNAAINKAVTVTVSGAASKSATQAGTPISWPSDDTFKDEAAYVITAVDALGNTSTYAFTIDKTAPVISAKDSDDADVVDNDVIKKDVTVTVTGGTPKATKDGTDLTYPPDGAFTADGVYVITAKDAAGNESTLTFTIDKTGPAIKGVDSDDEEVADGASINKTVTVTVSGADLVSKSATQGGVPMAEWPSDDTFKDEAAYVITAVDALGNTSTYAFTIDKTAPVISAKDSDDADVVDNDVIKKDVTVTVTGGTPKATKDGTLVEWADSLTEDGVYVIKAKDVAGNESTLTFTIDTIQPIAIAVLTADGLTAVTDGTTVDDAAGVTLTLTELNIKSITVKKDGADYRHYPLADGEDESMLWDGTTPLLLTEEGAYLIMIDDKAGNIFELSFEITFR